MSLESAANYPAERRPVRRRSVRRGKAYLKTLDDLDGRTAAAKVARKIVSGLQSDLGGADHITTGQKELVKRAALLGAYCEDCEVRWLRHEPVDVGEYLIATNAQRRVLSTIGVATRVARQVEADADEELERVWNEAQARVAANAEANEPGED
jgi:hypothetical protein